MGKTRGACASGTSTATISKQKGLANSQAFLEMVAGVGFEPTTFGLCLPLQLSLLRHILTDLWSGLSLRLSAKNQAERAPAIKSLHLLQ